MSYYLLKPKRDSDFYLDWSTFEDTAMSWGTRDEMLGMGYSEERLARCDARGTSAFWFWINPEDDFGEVWQNTGFLRYDNMEEFFTEIERLYPGDEDVPDATELLNKYPYLKAFLQELDEWEDDGSQQ